MIKPYRGPIMRDTALTGDPLTGGVVLELHMFHPDERREDEDREERASRR